MADPEPTTFQGLAQQLAERMAGIEIEPAEPTLVLPDQAELHVPERPKLEIPNRPPTRADAEAAGERATKVLNAAIDMDLPGIDAAMAEMAAADPAGIYAIVALFSWAAVAAFHHVTEVHVPVGDDAEFAGYLEAVSEKILLAAHLRSMREAAATLDEVPPEYRELVALCLLHIAADAVREGPVERPEPEEPPSPSPSSAEIVA